MLISFIDARISGNSRRLLVDLYEPFFLVFTNDVDEIMEVQDEDVTGKMKQLDITDSPPPRCSLPSTPTYSLTSTPAYSRERHSPLELPTPPETSTVGLDRNFRLVRQMMRHLEDHYLLSVGWTPSTTIDRAEGGVFTHFFHAYIHIIHLLRNYRQV